MNKKKRRTCEVFLFHIYVYICPIIMSIKKIKIKTGGYWRRITVKPFFGWTILFHVSQFFRVLKCTAVHVSTITCAQPFHTGIHSYLVLCLCVAIDAPAQYPLIFSYFFFLCRLPAHLFYFVFAYFGFSRSYNTIHRPCTPRVSFCFRCAHQNTKWMLL